MQTYISYYLAMSSYLVSAPFLRSDALDSLCRCFMSFPGIQYKQELIPVQIDSKSKLSKIIGQKLEGKTKKVLVKQKKGKPKWMALDEFISKWFEGI